MQKSESGGASRESRGFSSPLSVLYRPTPHFFALIKSSCLLQQYGHLGNRHAPFPLFSDFFNDFSTCSFRTQPLSFCLFLPFDFSPFCFLYFLLLPAPLSLSRSLLLLFIFLRPSLHPFFSFNFVINMISIFVKICVLTILLSCTH